MTWLYIQILLVRETYLLPDNWKRILKILYHIYMVIACLVSLRVLNTSGLRAVPVTLKRTILVGTLTLWYMPISNGSWKQAALKLSPNYSLEKLFN